MYRDMGWSDIIDELRETKRAHYEEHYMSVYDPVSKVKMSVLREIGNLLVKGGWEIVKPLSPSETVSQNDYEEDTYYDDSKGAYVTDHISESVTPLLPTDFVTEMSTEGIVTDAVTEVMFDLVTNASSTLSTWDTLISDGAHVASLIGEKVTSAVVNVTENLVLPNITEGEPEETPMLFKTFRNYHPMFLPGPLQVSMMLIIASAVLLLASK